MKIKRFVAKNIRQAMRMVKDELGADAVIMSNRSIDGGVEIVAARDFDEQTIRSKLNTNESPDSSVQAVELTDFETEKNNLHVVSSSRKANTEQAEPEHFSTPKGKTKTPSNRHIDKYVGYAEKVYQTDNSPQQEQANHHKSFAPPAQETSATPTSPPVRHLFIVNFSETGYQKLQLHAQKHLNYKTNMTHPLLSETPVL